MLTYCLQSWDSSVGVVTTLRTKRQTKFDCKSGRGNARY